MCVCGVISGIRFQWFLFIEPLVSLVFTGTEVTDLKPEPTNSTGTQTHSYFLYLILSILELFLSPCDSDIKDGRLKVTLDPQRLIMFVYLFINVGVLPTCSRLSQLFCCCFLSNS